MRHIGVLFILLLAGSKRTTRTDPHPSSQLPARGRKIETSESDEETNMRLVRTGTRMSLSSPFLVFLACLCDSIRTGHSFGLPVLRAPVLVVKGSRNRALIGLLQSSTTNRGASRRITIPQRLSRHHPKSTICHASQATDEKFSRNSSRGLGARLRAKWWKASWLPSLWKNWRRHHRHGTLEEEDPSSRSRTTCTHRNHRTLVRRIGRAAVACLALVSGRPLTALAAAGGGGFGGATKANMPPLERYVSLVGTPMRTVTTCQAVSPNQSLTLVSLQCRDLSDENSFHCHFYSLDCLWVWHCCMHVKLPLQPYIHGRSVKWPKKKKNKVKLVVYSES